MNVVERGSRRSAEEQKLGIEHSRRQELPQAYRIVL